MRLTLRTLLAWIDGVLPPAEQEELGAKVTASPIAPRLVERIHQAVANPTLPSPSGQAVGDDPNAVAEFLDNVLPADRLEDFERACLESQVNLAEVAACHRLLAEITQDPQASAPAAGDDRRRLIRAVAEGLSDESDPLAAEADISEAARAAAAIGSLGDGVGRASTVPAAGRREQPASIGAWLSAVAALALLVVLGLLLVRMIRPPHADDAQLQPEVAIAEPAVVEPAAEPEEQAAVPPPVAEPPAKPAPPVAVALPTMEVAPPADQPAVAAEGPATKPMDEADESLADDEAAAAGDAPPPQGRLLAGDPALKMVARGTESEWRPCLEGEALNAPQELLVPALCYPVVAWSDLRIRLLPGTKAAVSVDADGTPRIEIVFGRGVVWTDNASGGRCGITAGGLSGVATIGPRQPAGIEVLLVHRPGDDPAAMTPGQEARLIATGGIEWRQTQLDGTPAGEPLAGIGPTQAVPRMGGLRWTSAAPSAAGLINPAPEPAWLRQAGPADRTDRAARGAVAAVLRGIAPDHSAIEALRGLAEDRRAENRMAAASTLALAGDYHELVSILCAENPEEQPLREAQWQSLVADTIPLALGRGAHAAARLRQAFATRGPAGRGDELFRLAVGFSPSDLEAGAAEELVAALEDPLLVVRRFAWANLQPLAPEAEARFLYRPDRPASLNEKGVAWWRRRIEAMAGTPPAPP